MILDIEDVHFAYGGSRALDGCSFQVPRGEVTGLIGPNGAGKTTLIEVISGGLRPDQGQVLLDGANITGIGRTRVARRGVVRTFQLSRELGRLPVIENVMLAAQGQRGEALIPAIVARGRWRRQEEALRERAESLLEWVGLAEAREQRGNTLSGGQRRLLELARALMAEPKLLLLDEPTAGVYPAVVQLIAERIREVVAQGVSVVVVAHNMAFLSSVASDVIVMGQGRVLAQGSLEEVRANRDVVAAYLGA